MNHAFNYEEIFMGAFSKKRNNYKRTFQDDYRLKRMAEALKLKKGKLLDIGCGGGIITESLPYYYRGVKVFGCDISKTAIAYAKKFGSGKATYDVLKGKKFPYKDSTFDACICLDVMEHVPDVNFFLKEIRRILKQNGKFFLLVPCENQPMTYTWLFPKIGFGRLTFKHWGHVHPEFTHASVLTMLKKHGFHVNRQTYSEHWLYQLSNIFLYFLPKELLELVVGKHQAQKYNDQGVVKMQVSGKKSRDLFSIARNVWMRITGLVGRVRGWEIEAGKHTSFGAWKIHIYATINK